MGAREDGDQGPEAMFSIHGTRAHSNLSQSDDYLKVLVAVSSFRAESIYFYLSVAVAVADSHSPSLEKWSFPLQLKTI